MSTPDFFPNTPFAWVFCCVVMALTAIAAYIDTKTAKIPNRLSVIILFLGVIFTLIRSTWQGVVEHPLFVFDTGEWWLGLLDGVLFTLVGFLVAFFGFFAFWIFGLAGGGDVKLMAALGAWFGVVGFFFLWVGSIVMLLFWSGFVIIYTKATGKKTVGSPAAPQPKLSKQQKHQKGSKPTPVKRGIQVTYSVPVALATIAVCLWMYRVDLQLMPPKPQPAVPPTGGIVDASPKPN